jgi:hypothetical protein
MLWRGQLSKLIVRIYFKLGSRLRGNDKIEGVMAVEAAKGCVDAGMTGGKC